MKKNKQDKRILICVLGCVMVLCGCSRQEPVFTDMQETTSAEENTWQEIVATADGADSAAGMDTQDAGMPVVVHICGAVVSPGVYELPPGSRIVDAVELAGGLCEEADESYVNLAQIPADGEQIFIPTYEEAKLLKQSSPENGVSGGKVNINTADKALLCSLPGIGDTRAADIIAYRRDHGGFATVEDIMHVTGIKEASFQKIKELITVN